MAVATGARPFASRSEWLGAMNDPRYPAVHENGVPNTQHDAAFAAAVDQRMMASPDLGALPES